MAKDSMFSDVLLHKRTFMRNECRDFYETICKMAESEDTHAV